MNTSVSMIIISIVLLMVIVYVVIYRYSSISLILSLLTTICLVAYNSGKVLSILTDGNTTTYMMQSYVIQALIAFAFSFEYCRSDHNFIALFAVVLLSMILNMYMASKIIAVFYIFSILYLIFFMIIEYRKEYKGFA